MENELWLKKIKERLNDHSEPVPASGWEQLEEHLTASGASMKETRKVILFRRWTMAAAAALLVAVSSISLWLLNSSVGDEIRHTSVSSLVTAPDALPEQTAPAIQANPSPSIQQVDRLHLAMAHNMVAQQKEILKDNEVPQAQTLPDVVNSTTKPQVEKPETTEKEDVIIAEKEKERYHPSGKDKLHLPSKKKTNANRKQKGWAVGLSIGNTGGLLQNNLAEDREYMFSNSPGGIFYGDNMDLSFTANKILTIPQGKDVIFKNGIPYLQHNTRAIASINHKQPLSFGMSVRKNLDKGFSVESGLTYTYLASDVVFKGNPEKMSQKLHYIGIPIRANWNFVENGDFTVYISAGGTVEKCIYGRIGSENETVKPLQLSVMGAMGAQYSISKRIGIYIEPGISYFFDDGSTVQTIRKENPCNFTLQAGIRLTY